MVHATMAVATGMAWVFGLRPPIGGEARCQPFFPSAGKLRTMPA